MKRPNTHDVVVRLYADDDLLLLKLRSKFEINDGAPVSCSEVMRRALRAMAKKERVES